MIFNRVWSMPSANTFSIKPIKELILKYKKGFTIDPFANDSKLADYTNDINPAHETTHHMDALEFLKGFDEKAIDTVLFDPPYSPRQISECYKGLGLKVNMKTTQSSFWSNLKKEISRIVKPGGIVISCGWNSGGIGKKYGFDIKEILIVPHGGSHNDTIVTVEFKEEE